MSMVLDRIQVNKEKKQFQHIVEDITSTIPAVRWRYSAYSNERYPLRAYASALRGSGLDAEEALVIAVTWRNPRDGNGDRLVVGANILDEDGMILAESPRFEVPVPEESVVLEFPDRVTRDVTHEVQAAMLKISQWLDSQTATIQKVLVGPAK